MFFKIEFFLNEKTGGAIFTFKDKENVLIDGKYLKEMICLSKHHQQLIVPQIFCKIILYFQVIVISITDADEKLTH